MENEFYSALKSFIESHPQDWKERLKDKPFNLKTIRQVDYNPNWYMLVYNLFASDFDPDHSSVEDVKALKACRGSIVDITNLADKGTVDIICAPYSKFFNISEPFCDEIDWASAKTFDKIDGILIKAFKYNNAVYWATNGGSDPDQKMQDCVSADSIKEIATKDAKTYFDLLKYALSVDSPDVSIISEAIDGTSGHKVTSSGGWCDKIPNGSTVMLELISPRNRIICKYNDTKLYFHGFRDENLVEHNTQEIAEKYGIPFARPKEYNIQNEQELNDFLSTFDGQEQEGCVVVDKYWRRAKVKSPSYLKIKFIKKEDIFSKKDLFNAVVDKSFDDIIGYFPEVKAYIDEILSKVSLLKEHIEFYSKIILQKYKELNCSKKDFAEYVLSNKQSTRAFWFTVIKDNYDNEKYLNTNVLKKDKYEDFEKFFEEISKEVELYKS